MKIHWKLESARFDSEPVEFGQDSEHMIAGLVTATPPPDEGWQVVAGGYTVSGPGIGGGPGLGAPGVLVYNTNVDPESNRYRASAQLAEVPEENADTFTFGTYCICVRVVPTVGSI